MPKSWDHTHMFLHGKMFRIEQNQVWEMFSYDMRSVIFVTISQPYHSLHRRNPVSQPQVNGLKNLSNTTDVSEPPCKTQANPGMSETGKTNTSITSRGAVAPLLSAVGVLSSMRVWTRARQVNHEAHGANLGCPTPGINDICLDVLAWSISERRMDSDGFMLPGTELGSSVSLLHIGSLLKVHHMISPELLRPRAQVTNRGLQQELAAIGSAIGSQSAMALSVA